MKCIICSNVCEENQNVYGIIDEEGVLLTLCSLHAEASKKVCENHRIQIPVMKQASLYLDNIRPDINTEPEKWITWDPVAELVRIYKRLLSENEGSQRTIEKEFVDTSIKIHRRKNIPGDKIRLVERKNMVNDLLLDILALVTEKDKITSKPEIFVTYDDMGLAEKRTEIFGDKKNGLYMYGKPIQSGIGVHGEYSSWEFWGLPPRIIIKVEGEFDMRGGNNNFLEINITAEKNKVDKLSQLINSSALFNL